MQREAAALGHEAGVPVEAELGAVLGHEAGPLPPYDELFASGKGFTDPLEARQFVRATGCDWLAFGVLVPARVGDDIGLFLVTSAIGRAWCGYACPQTVYTEIFLWVERHLEGDHPAK